ncbi:fasciclin domain-containing protein [Actibacterium sp. 188UL27-1]|uniref:fasciclin domain-containing protein n=1 Tax=Actibacterium sp. 188UL27-1 TaxID=2786961 RepID=UPI001956D3A5|nr:fasciclin domain-containing protein [Actibacterium sp. 188UL27-1]MBM7069549.1 fasciclin domain-containing protein [Actibacterium sp. 188UL27-1]
MRSILTATAICLSAVTTQAADIVEQAQQDDRLSTLVGAVEAAGLVDTLRGKGPFTIYAPQNTAFDALPPEMVSDLLRPENKDQLTDLLLYHVDDRKLTSNMFPMRPTHFKPVLTSERLCITASEAGVSIADSTPETANVVVADIKADNGVIHVIDKVLIPGKRPICHKKKR